MDRIPKICTITLILVHTLAVFDETEKPQQINERFTIVGECE
ncbi:Hypothetical protein Tpal_2561 [Trichococcus palustris]|jgi:hypothetical protein|uniref:Uncharacterized protein n=1 Tax=Trichococcus palustris TaxID=140314 RepID=A0A143YWX2_9LACT|nr:Hypothetical protein Tpal_2561 [Trichococcus palustris]SFK90047.1 hypothetical protein SAMN04488076_10867 [Trichococcus palustris]